MKRILLTSTALVAFAGAAAADVSLSGEASFSYNTIDGYANATEITATGSQALDNGYTATASLTFVESTAPVCTTTIDDNNTINDTSDDTAETTCTNTGGISAGAITIASDIASISYGSDLDQAAYLGAEVGLMAANDFFAEENAGGETITGSATVAGATIAVSLDANGDYQLGVSSSMGGTDLAFAMIGTDFAARIGGATGDVDYAIGYTSAGAFGVDVATTAGGADLTIAMADGSDWEVGASMPLGAATVGLTLADGGAWTASAETTLDAATISLAVDDAGGYDASIAYAAGGVGVDFATDEANVWTLEASYDLGNGITAGAGTDGTDQYVMVDYDLGGGANLSLDYASADNAVDADLELVEGTTVAVGFSF